jgi:two-component sensor histidine kinase
MAARKRKPAVIEEVEVTKETREDRLIRLAHARVKKAMNAIRLIGNLSAYKPTDEQVDAIMEALGDSCARIDARLRGTKKDVVPFTLTRVA